MPQHQDQEARVEQPLERRRHEVAREDIREPVEARSAKPVAREDRRAARSRTASSSGEEAPHVQLEP